MKNTISLLAFGALAAVAADVLAAVVIPETTALSVTQRTKGRIAVRYSLTAPAVVTFDVTTNGVSVGDEKLWDVSGDICRELTDGPHEFVWNARTTIPDWRADLKVVLTAWPLNDKPPYMVVDLTNDETIAAADRIRYYASSNAVPGGIVANPAYKTTAMVFKRIYARCLSVTCDVRQKWSDSPKKTMVVMDHDYYLGVFEVTQAQWKNVWKGSNTITPLFRKDGDGRPMDNITYCHIRESRNNSRQTAYQYPNPPNAASYLGDMRTLCANLVDFELPTCVEWMFAAAGGFGLYYWGDGTPVTTSGNQGAVQFVCPNLARLGRYAYNGGWVPKDAAERQNVTTNDLSHGTAIVGTYRPNAYGIYDMHGNVLERIADRDSVCYGGDCHREPSYCIAQSTVEEVGAAGTCYSYGRGTYSGFRVACRNGLK